MSERNSLQKSSVSTNAIRDTINCFSTTKSFSIAYSGGLDSHVLLHVMSQLKKNHPEIHIQAVHVNHQVNPRANEWEKHCEKICAELHIPIHIEKVDLNLKSGDSFEENAREARYSALQKYIDKNSILLTAHNLNDQAETFLLQALRGAGSKGLSAMPVKKKCGEGFLIRPLLSFSRDELEKYARENHLQWIEDDSNTDPRFRRNFLRHEIFPLLKKQYPAVLNNFARSATLLSEHEKIISDIAKQDYVLCREDAKKLSREKLSKLSPERQRLVLREWFRENNHRMPNQKHLKHIQKDVLNAAPDAHPVFSLSHCTIKRDRFHLIFSR